MKNHIDVADFLDDAKIEIRNLLSSHFVGPHKERALQWDSILNYSTALFQAWAEVEEKWMSLEPIF